MRGGEKSPEKGLKLPRKLQPGGPCASFEFQSHSWILGDLTLLSREGPGGRLFGSFDPSFPRNKMPRGSKPL